MEKANLRVLREPNEVLEQLYVLLGVIQAAKPNDRSNRDRYFAIVITDFEKLIAVFELYCLQETENE